MRNVKGFFLVIFLFIILIDCGPKKEIMFEPKKEDYEGAVQLVMTGPEKKIFRKLKDEEMREEFMKEFWDKRDPNLSTEINEFKEEFEARVTYAGLHYKSEGIPGWKTDRGRIYIYLGPPDHIYEQPYLNYPNLKARIVWVYYRYKLGLEFEDRTGMNRFDMRINPVYSFRLMDAISRSQFGLISRDEDLSDEKPAEVELDYDKEKKEIVFRIPNSALLYKEENDYFLVDLRFDFYIYSEEGIKKDKFSINKNFRELKDEVLKMEKITFSFPYDYSEPGEYYMDVKVSDSDGIAKFRKIVNVKIGNS